MIPDRQCPVCSVPAVPSFYANVGNGTVEVFQCPGCGSYIKESFFVSDTARTFYEHYDIHEKHYEVSVGEMDNITSRLERIQRFVKGGRLLEIGCGRGHFLSEVRKKGWGARGVELEGSARYNLLPDIQGSVDFIRSEKDYDSIESSAYDVICSYQVFEHLAEPLASLKHWVRGLKKGGILLVNTPNASSWGARLHQTRWIHHARRDHLILYSNRALMKLYRGHGLSVLYRYYGGPPFICSRVRCSPASSNFPDSSNDSLSESPIMQPSKPLTMWLYRAKMITQLARFAIYCFGLGDHIEIIGRKL